MEHEFSGQFKLGPRETRRKDKGRKRPQAARQARKRRSTFLKTLGKPGPRGV